MTYPHPEHVPVPTRKQTELVWKEGDQYHIKTACGQYTVAKYFGRDSVSYAAWHYKKLLDFAPTAKAATAICSAHFEQESPP